MRVAVLGRGLIGAAAARHLAKAGHEVLLIGPAEPADKRTHRGVFASHYDEGRITRRADASPFWAEASAASIARYGEIEAEGGIAFFTEVGGMMAGPDASPWMAKVRATVEALALTHQALDRAALADRFPQFDFPEDYAAIYEPEGAGHVSPRRLVAAQTEAARRLGAEAIEVEALGIDETGSGVRIATAAGSFDADRALVAAGAMSDHLLARPPRNRVYARTVALFEVDEAEGRRLAPTPSLVPEWAGSSGPYLLPPIRYPDGRLRLKIGGDPVDRPLGSPAEIGDWFRSGGDPAVRDHLEAVFREIMPGVAIRATSMDACVTTYSDDGLPEIRAVAERIAVATAGNGAGAKCSDELGRRGAAAALAGLREEEPAS
ncbi:MAG: FAD-dependent oxidoreductase [Pseudomonadota bacterium]